MSEIKIVKMSEKLKKEAKLLFLKGNKFGCAELLSNFLAKNYPNITPKHPRIAGSRWKELVADFILGEFSSRHYLTLQFGLSIRNAELVMAELNYWNEVL